MKIVVISTSIFQLGKSGLRGYGGLEQIAWHCAKGLAERGHQVAIIAPEGSECPGCVVVPVPQGISEKEMHNKTWGVLQQFDCVIDHSWGKWSYMLKAEGNLPVPILGVMHAPVNTMYGTLPPVEKPCFVCISEDQASHFESLHGRKAKVCYNGIDTNFYKPMNLPRSDRFLFLARFSRIKGASLAIEACLKAGVGLDLVGDTQITGEPDYYNHCVALANQESAWWDKSRGKQIRIVGGVSRGETVHHFSKAYTMLHPVKEFREPFGLAPLEANACGCPVICWNYGAGRETIGGVGGWVVNSMDELVGAIKRAVDCSDDDMAIRREQAVVNARRFSIERMQDRYQELCLDAVQNGGW